MTTTKTELAPGWRPSLVAIDLTREEADALEALLPAGHPIRARVHVATHPLVVWVCSECGSPDVECGRWVAQNGYVSGAETGDGRSNNFCSACDSHVNLDEIDADTLARLP